MERGEKQGKKEGQVKKEEGKTQIQVLLNKL